MTTARHVLHDLDPTAAPPKSKKSEHGPSGATDRSLLRSFRRGGGTQKGEMGLWALAQPLRGWNLRPGCGRMRSSEAYNDQLAPKMRPRFRRRSAKPAAEERLTLNTPQPNMSNFIHDVLNDPQEYWPFLVLLAGILMFWAVLCASGLVSFRVASRRRKFWFALCPLLLGLPCLLGSSPVSIEAHGFRLNVDLRWLFIVPVVLGIAGLASWRRRRSETLV